MSVRTSSYEKGQELAAAGKDEAALIAFEEACKEEPKNFKAVFGVGLMLQRLGQHTDALAAFARLLEMHPRLPEAYYSRALSLQGLSRYEDALNDLNIALDLRTDYLDATYARGVCLKKLNRYEEALVAYSRILAHKPYPPASHGRATVRYALGDYAGAIADFSDYLAAGNDSYDVRLLRGLAFHRIGRHAEAVDDLTCAITYCPDVGSTYIRRWQVFKDLGDDKRAQEDFAVGSKLLDKREEKSGR